MTEDRICGVCGHFALPADREVICKMCISPDPAWELWQRTVAELTTLERLLARCERSYKICLLSVDAKRREITMLKKELRALQNRTAISDTEWFVRERNNILEAEVEKLRTDLERNSGLTAESRQQRAPQ